MARKLPWRGACSGLSALLLLGSIAYLIKRSILEHSADVDFRFIWTAGKLWALGVDPYSPRFTTLGRVLFPLGNDITYWLYPPQWWLICRALAAVTAGQALPIWRGINALLLVAAATALALAVRRVRPATPPWVLGLLIATMALMESTAQNLLLGQTSILVFAGFCLMAVALLTARPLPMIAAVVLLLLKPHFALPIVICFAVTRTWRRPVLIGVAVTVLASLPQIIGHGLLPTVTGWLGNMARHGQLPSNQPQKMIGFSHLVWQITGAKLSTGWDIALDVAASGTLAGLIGRHRVLNDRDQAALGCGLIASAMFFLPLHAYDLVALGPMAMLALILGGAPRYLAWAAVALALRPGIISAQFGDRLSGDLLLLSLAGLLGVIAAAIAAVSRPRSAGS